MTNMKMAPAHYNEIKEGIRAVIDHHGKEAILADYKDQTLMRMMWDLLRMVCFDWQYDDDHPSFLRGRVRILPYKNRLWDLYDDIGENTGSGVMNGRLNDDHIATALRNIAKELGLNIP